MGNNKNVRDIIVTLFINLLHYFQVVQTVPTEMAGLPEPLVAAAIGNSHVVLRMRYNLNLEACMSINF